MNVKVVSNTNINGFNNSCEILTDQGYKPRGPLHISRAENIREMGCAVYIQQFIKEDEEEPSNEVRRLQEVILDLQNKVILSNRKDRVK